MNAMRITIAISDEQFAMYYRLAISYEAACNRKSLIANPSFIANCQLLISPTEGL
jgi:hypothetical protein